MVNLKKLLRKPIPEEYVQESTKLLANETLLSKKPSKEITTLIFRLGKEWFALSTLVFCEIVENLIVHNLPHRSGEVLKGIVNVRGQLKLCISLHNFLDVVKEKNKNSNSFQRFLEIEYQNDNWVFCADEIYGIYHFEESQLTNVPVTVSKSAANYLKAIVQLDDKHIGLLDEELLFQSLRRSLL